MTQEEKIVRYLGYLLPKDGGYVNGMRYVQPMKDEQYAEFEKIIRVSSELRPFVIDFMGLEENFCVFDRIPAEFKSGIEALTNPMIEGALGGARRLIIAQNALSNFLYSTSAFRDRSQTRLRELYGENSQQYKALDDAISAAYDEAFEYRLLYNLRNYAQHHDIPLSLVPVQANLNQQTNKIEALVSVVLAPDKLVSNPKVQKQFQTKELSGLTEDIDLSACAKVFFRLHARLLKTIINMQAARIDEMSAYRDAVTRVLKLPPGAFPVIWEGDMPLHDGAIANSRFTHFSFDELNLLLVLYEHLERLTGGVEK